MYAHYFGLHEKPFSIAPDPRYLYQSERHAEALAHLLYGVEEAGGFIQLTGEVGTGKTTLTRALLNQLPENVEVAMILNPRLSEREFLQTICKELRMFWMVKTESIKELIDALNAHFLKAHAEGRRVVLIIDEAQNLDAELLEEIRLLTNLETAERKLLQIILIGQPELRQTLGRADLRQLAQRITARYHLEPLSRDEVIRYVDHRLKVAGASREIFSPGALREIHRLSQGVPRLINVICDRALLGAYTTEAATVDARLVRKAAAEVKGERVRRPGGVWPRIGVAAAGVALAVMATFFGWRQFATNTSGDSQAMAGTPPFAQAGPVVRAVPDEADATEEAGATMQHQAADALPPESSQAGTAPAGAAIAGPAEDLQTLLARSRDDTDNQTAFRELFRMWNSDYVPGPTRACDQARTQGLRCLFQRGSWNHLTTLNVPAMLTLTDSLGENHQVVLEGTDETGAVTLRIGGVSYQVPLAEVMALWFGDSLLLWRPHPQAGGLLAPGARGAGVAWLRERLDALGIAPAAAGGSAIYDQVLAERVRNFQRRYGLRVDGIAGERTLIKLQALAPEPGMPVLAGTS